MKPSVPAWGTFFLGENENWIRRRIQKRIKPHACYQVELIVPVKGKALEGPVAGWNLFRLESAEPFGFPLKSQSHPKVRVLQGVTKHLFYTSRHERRTLLQRSCAEPVFSGQTLAVLIPISKSPRWWQMAQDERQSYFQTQAGKEGHTAIGLRYADKIFRKLYHCRYSDAAAPYDFLTYFEFHRSHTGDFRRLVDELRDPRRNPEWNYVASEFEIWLNRTG